MEFIIGRHDSDIVLQSDAVSRRHALLSFSQDGNVTIRDAGSRNGTFLCGPGGAETRVNAEPAAVALETVIRFGDERARISDLIVQLLERRVASRRELARGWHGGTADRLLMAYGGRAAVLDGASTAHPPQPPIRLETLPQPPRKPVAEGGPRRKPRRNPETGDIVDG